MGKTAIVVGSGIAGLASAIRLAKRGHIVSVFEANEYPGGKLTEIKLNEYRFDAGPSLFTLPENIEELYKLCGLHTPDHFKYKKLESTCNYFWEDDTNLTAWTDHNKLAQEFESKLGEPSKNILQALEKSSFLYEYLAPIFMKRSIHQKRTWLGSDAFKAYSKLSKFGFSQTMHKANSKQFDNDKTVQLFNRYATYNGSDPYQTPATLNIIPHLEFGIGAFFPEGGMHQITMSLYRLAKQMGVKFYFDTPVKRIVVHEGKAKGVDTKMGFHKSDYVVSNMDVVGTYKKLLSGEKQPKKLLKQPKSSSAIIFYWGIKKTFDQLDLHNIFFSDNYKEEFEHIFKHKSLFEDPTVYLNITSTENPADAPEGCMNWFTMVNAPNNSGQDWDSLIAQARKSILEKLSRILKTDIEPLIEVEDILDPRTIEIRTSSDTGALYGNSSNNKYAAFLRHANFNHDIQNLYFCGGSVHPGGGIPLCLLSAKIVDEVMK